MKGKVPHIVQYQGSKRILAPQILRYMPKKIKRLIEPFAGMAAVSIATAYECRVKQIVLNDLNPSVINMLCEAVEYPERLLVAYKKVWDEQFSFPSGHIEHFYFVRDRFNNGENSPANTLYMLARCVKGSVRYGKNGKFNQSPDKRRHGTNPSTLEDNLYYISQLLKGKTIFYSFDYKKILEMTEPGDLVYMDPPYQGVSNVRDNRYLAGVSFDEFSDSVALLDKKGIDYIISYDGKCGTKEYGKTLPSSLRCKKILLDAGVSSQSTLLGEKKTTYEALYVSDSLLDGQITQSRRSLLEAI